MRIRRGFILLSKREMEAAPSTGEVADKLPLLKTNAGPGSEKWGERLKEEYKVLIEYIKFNKAQDNEWFKIQSNKEGIKYDFFKNCIIDGQENAGTSTTWLSTSLICSSKFLPLTHNLQSKLSSQNLMGRHRRCIEEAKFAWIYTLLHSGKAKLLILELHTHSLWLYYTLMQTML